MSYLPTDKDAEYRAHHEANTEWQREHREQWPPNNESEDEAHGMYIDRRQVRLVRLLDAEPKLTPARFLARLLLGMLAVLAFVLGLTFCAARGWLP